MPGTPADRVSLHRRGGYRAPHSRLAARLHEPPRFSALCRSGASREDGRAASEARLKASLHAFRGGRVQPALPAGAASEFGGEARGELGEADVPPRGQLERGGRLRCRGAGAGSWAERRSTKSASSAMYSSSASRGTLAGSRSQSRAIAVPAPAAADAA
jgi:hypothetical protein